MVLIAITTMDEKNGSKMNIDSWNDSAVEGVGLKSLVKLLLNSAEQMQK